MTRVSKVRRGMVAKALGVGTNGWHGRPLDHPQNTAARRDERRRVPPCRFSTVENLAHDWLLVFPGHEKQHRTRTIQKRERDRHAWYGGLYGRGRFNSARPSHTFLQRGRRGEKRGGMTIGP